MKLNLMQERIQELFAIFVAEMKASKAMNRGDINHVSEVILLPLLSRCYGYANLENLNSAEYFNYPGVDLGDSSARVAIQVTSTTTSTKVKETLAQFVDKELYKQYDRLIVYILTEKPGRFTGKGYDKIIPNQQSHREVRRGGFARGATCAGTRRPRIVGADFNQTN